MADEISFLSTGRTLKEKCAALKSVQESKEEVDDEQSEKLLGEIENIMWNVLDPTNSEVLKNEMMIRKLVNGCRSLVAGGDLFEDFSRTGKLILSIKFLILLGSSWFSSRI